MAIVRTTQKDIGNYEAKLLGPLTTRQTIIMAIGVIPAVLIDYVLYNTGIDMYSLFGITMIIMAIPVFIAFGKTVTYGMNPEDFIKEYYLYHILRPKVRLYKTELLDDVIWEKESKKKAKELGQETGTTNKKNKEKIKGKKESNPLATKYKDKKYKTYSHIESKEFKSFN